MAHGAAAIRLGSNAAPTGEGRLAPLAPLSQPRVWGNGRSTRDVLILIVRRLIGPQPGTLAAMKKAPALVALGKRVRTLRTNRGWSQEEFAERCGLDRTYIGGVERGERNVGALNLVQIAAALGVSVGALFDRRPAKGSRPK